MLTAVGDTKRALDFFQKAIALDENAAAAYYSAGNIFYENEQFQQAKNMFETALKKG